MGQGIGGFDIVYAAVVLAGQGEFPDKLSQRLIVRVFKLPGFAEKCYLRISACRFAVPVEQKVTRASSQDMCGVEVSR